MMAREFGIEKETQNPFLVPRQSSLMKQWGPLSLEHFPYHLPFSLYWMQERKNSFWGLPRQQVAVHGLCRPDQSSALIGFLGWGWTLNQRFQYLRISVSAGLSGMEPHRYKHCINTFQILAKMPHDFLFYLISANLPWRLSMFLCFLLFRICTHSRVMY